jgi:hypothetical protein
MTTPEPPEEPTARGSRCGTTTGYKRHQRAGEKPCDACAAAVAEYGRRYREAPRRVQVQRIHSAAQGIAFTTLRKRYPDEYLVLYQDAKKRLYDELEGILNADGDPHP